MSFWVYILASGKNGTLCIGSTDDLLRRVWEHREGVVPGFTRRYGVKTFVWFEAHETRESCLLRERQMKKWNRKWKLQTIERANPAWRDLAPELGLADSVLGSPLSAGMNDCGLGGAPNSVRPRPRAGTQGQSRYKPRPDGEA